MAKLVCHGEKFKRSAVTNIESHNDRLKDNYSNKDIDPTRTYLNYDLIERKERYFVFINRMIKGRKNPRGKKLRKDATVLTEFVISSGNEFFEGLSMEQQKIYFQISLDYLKSVFGEQNCIYATVHNDEHTPHLHFGFVPMTEDNRLCCKEIMTKQVLRQIQNELPKRLQKAGFEIERGEIDSQASHRTVKKYKADMEKEKAELSAAIEAQKKELEALANMKEEKSVAKKLSVYKMETELRELRIFRQTAEKFLAEKGLLDFFRKLLIHSNNRER